MLFAAGMGIGLMFWAVAEPTAYFTGWYETPFNVEPNTPEAANLAMGATMYHWGLHPWAIYAIVALSLAFFSFNKNMPLTIRSAFFPLLRDKVWGWPGHIIDILAVVATIFGLATSLGFGAQQAAAGLSYLFGVSDGINVQMAIIVGVTALALISVLRGLDGGVKVLSNVNMSLAGILLFFVIFAGPTMTVLETLWVTSSSYVATFFNSVIRLVVKTKPGSRVGLCSIGHGGSPGHRSLVCSSPAFPAAVPCVSSSPQF